MNICIKAGFPVNGAGPIVGNLSQEVGERLPTGFRLTTDHGSQFLAQWRLGRLTDFENWAQEKNLPITAMETQMAFLFYELKRDYPALDKMLREGTRPIANLTANFMLMFERPNRDPAVNRLDKRIAYANKCVAAMKGEKAVEKPGISDDQIVGIPTIGGAGAVAYTAGVWGADAALAVFIAAVILITAVVWYTHRRKTAVQPPLEPQHEAFPELDEVAAAIGEIKSAQARMEAAKMVLLMHRQKADELLAQLEEKK
jgi:hypothetical protein